jgi:cytochrome P450
MPKKKLPPGPSLFSRFGEPPKSQLDYLINLMHRYGDIAKMPSFFNVFLINHVDTIAEILQNRPFDFTKDNWGYKRLGKFLGNGLLTSENETWKTRRRLLQPAFHRQIFMEAAPLIVETTEAMLNQWQSQYIQKNKSFNITREMLNLVLTISAKILFSKDLGKDTSKIIKWVNTGHRGITKNLWISRFFPTVNNLQFYHALDQLEEYARFLIQERRKNPTPRKDLLALLLQAKDEAGEDLPEQTIIDEIKTFLVTGHETSGYALAWTWWHLTQYPDVLEKVKAEIATVLGDRNATFEDVAQLTYTRRVIEESIRIYPPIWLFTRKSIHPFNVQNYEIPAKSNIIICAYTLHRHPRYWPNPEQFDPDRFLPENVAKRPKLAYLPFGAGPRVCIAGTFAMLQIPLILATMLQKVEIQNKTKKCLTLYPQFSLKHRKPFLVCARSSSYA